ncbi:821_t:CDS:2, partial [Gigaspora rosea]
EMNTGSEVHSKEGAEEDKMEMVLAPITENNKVEEGNSEENDINKGEDEEIANDQKGVQEETEDRFTMVYNKKKKKGKGKNTAIETNRYSLYKTAKKNGSGNSTLKYNKFNKLR